MDVASHASGGDVLPPVPEMCLERDADYERAPTATNIAESFLSERVQIPGHSYGRWLARLGIPNRSASGVPTKQYCLASMSAKMRSQASSGSSGNR